MRLVDVSAPLATKRKSESARTGPGSQSPQPNQRRLNDTPARYCHTVPLTALRTSDHKFSDTAYAISPEIAVLPRRVYDEAKRPSPQNHRKDWGVSSVQQRLQVADSRVTLHVSEFSRPCSAYPKLAHRQIV